jgi:hypothetical protein
MSVVTRRTRQPIRAGSVVPVAVGRVPSAADVPAARPDSSFHFKGDLVRRPSVVEPPAPRRRETLLPDRRRRANSRQDGVEGIGGHGVAPFLRRIASSSCSRNRSLSALRACFPPAAGRSRCAGPSAPSAVCVLGAPAVPFPGQSRSGELSASAGPSARPPAGSPRSGCGAVASADGSDGSDDCA